MASITKRGDSYRIRVFVGENGKGKQTVISETYRPTATTKRKIEQELQAEADRLEKKVKAGKVLAKDKITFREYFETWLQDYGSKSLYPATLELTENAINYVFMPVIGDIRLQMITAKHLQKIINEREKDGIAPSTIRRNFTAISPVFAQAVEDEIIEANPCDRVKFPKQEKEEKDIFTEEQTRRFLTALSEGIDVYVPKKVRKNGRSLPERHEHVVIPTRWKLYFTLAAYSGARRGELIGLQWKNIDFKKHLITIDHNTSRAKSEGGQFDKSPKSESGKRAFTVPIVCFDMLMEWREEQERICRSLGSAWKGQKIINFDKQYIFIKEDGSQMGLSSPGNKLKQYIEYYNTSIEYEALQEQNVILREKILTKKLPVLNLHRLRHTNGSNLIAQGVDPATVAKRLGHKKISTTLDIYTHALPEQDVEASNVLERAFGTAGTTQTLELTEDEIRLILASRENGQVLVKNWS